MDIKINLVIPTKGRANTISSHKYIDNCVICVPKGELALYKEFNPNAEYVTHPENIIGIARKRQWIYDKFKNVFMIDDDLKGLLKMTAKRGESSYVAPEKAYWIIQNLGNIARLAGIHLFGFSNWVRPEHYHGHTPYNLTGYINGCGLGMLETGKQHLVFNDRIKTNNDFYIAGVNAHFYRRALIDRRYCFSQDSFGDNIGGCADVRTNEAEKQDFDLLRMFFGSAIKQKKAGSTTIKHKYSKTLEIPF